MSLRWINCRLIVLTSGFLLLATAYYSGADIDELTVARKRLISPLPCGEAPAVKAVATVNPDSHSAYLDDWVLISVCHLADLLAQASAAQAPVTLFVEGMDTGNKPVGVDSESGTLTFVLERDEGNRQLWKPYLYDPLFDPDVLVRVSVGVRGERPLPRVPNANLAIRILKLYIGWTTWIWFGLLVALIAVLILAASHTDMLRDGPTSEGRRRPYSLSRSQMAWWFFLIVVSYVYIWSVTGDRDTIPFSTLGLMGISAATALLGTAIPTREGEDQESKGWWRDLVIDESGVVALDRLQIVVWTIILSGIFLTSVVWELAMPEFNATILALMGISSGTYLGFKLPRKS